MAAEVGALALTPEAIAMLNSWDVNPAHQTLLQGVGIWTTGDLMTVEADTLRRIPDFLPGQRQRILNGQKTRLEVAGATSVQGKRAKKIVGSLVSRGQVPSDLQAAVDDKQSGGISELASLVSESHMKKSVKTEFEYMLFQARMKDELEKEGTAEAGRALEEFNAFYEYTTKTLKMKFGGDWSMVVDYITAYLDAHDGSFSPCRDDLVYMVVKQKKAEKETKAVSHDLVLLKAHFLKEMEEAKQREIALMRSEFSQEMDDLKQKGPLKTPDFADDGKSKEERKWCRNCGRNMKVSLNHPKLCSKRCYTCNNNKDECGCEELKKMKEARASEQSSSQDAAATKLAEALVGKKKD